MIQTGRNATIRPVQAPARICSGACPFFEPIYDLGRKVAGTGVCGKHGGETTVRVGHPCLWTAMARPDLAGRISAPHPRTVS